MLKVDDFQIGWGFAGEFMVIGRERNVVGIQFRGQIDVTQGGGKGLDEGITTVSVISRQCSDG